MLLLFRGHNGPAVRAILGAIFVVIGIATRGALLDAIGAVLIAWGGIGVLSSQRVRRQRQIDGGRPTS
jgi:TRAP-type mannitol/chloroaromatic compound transport system permease large subunit